MSTPITSITAPAWLARFALRADARPGRAALTVALAAWLLTTSLASPPLWFLREGHFLQGRDADLLALAQDPLRRDIKEPILCYRLTTPLLAHVLHLPGAWPLAIPYMSLVALYAVLYTAVRRRADAPLATLAVLLVALSFTTFWSNTRWGFADPVTHLAGAVCLLTPAAPTVFIATLLGALNDERFVLLLPFVALWHLLPPVGTAEPGKIVWRPTLTIAAAAGGGLLTVLLIRHALKVGWIGPGISPQTYRQGVFTQAATVLTPAFLGSYALNVLMGWRWAWWLPFAACAAMPAGYRAAYFLFLAAGVLAAGTVADVARSTGFLFPAFLLAVVWFHGQDAFRLRRQLSITLVLCMLTPVGYFTGYHFNWIPPLPEALWRYWRT